jgi:ATP-binding cassette subfamily B protein
MGGVRGLINKVPEISRTEAVLDRMAEFFRPAPAPARAGSGGISFDDVDFGYDGKKVLSGLSFSIAPGRRMLVSGGNGCGKSTLAGLVYGFLDPDSGKVSSFAPAAISACISPHGFIPGTLGDNLGYDGLDEERRRYADRLLADLGMASLLDKDPESMSAGQKKKAEVIMGLLKEAELYLFDEPLANVDVDGKGRIMEHIFERAKGRTLLVIMHGDEEYRARFDGELALS